MRTVLALSLVFVGCRSLPVETPEPISSAAPSTLPEASASEPIPPTPWVLEYDGLLVDSISADATGIYVAMSRVPGQPVRLPGHQQSDDTETVFALRLSHDGVLQRIHAFEGDGLDDGIVRGSLLTLSSFGSVAAAGEAFTAPSREAVFGMPFVAVVVRLAETEEVVARVPDVESAEAWPLTDERVIVASQHRNERDETTAQLQLFMRGSSRWAVTLPDVTVTAVLETAQGTWVALGVSSAVADVRRLDLQTGTLTDAIFQVQAKPTEGVSITALTEGPRAWGGKSRPFSASRGSEELLLDALGHVTAVDDRDTLVNVYQVEPDRGRPTVERPGMYLLREGEATRVGRAGSRAVLTTTHVVLADDCAGRPCIRGVVRR